jgi:hypothetical protein
MDGRGLTSMDVRSNGLTESKSPGLKGSALHVIGSAPLPKSSNATRVKNHAVAFGTKSTNAVAPVT